MHLGEGGEYSLAIHHTDQEMLEWGLSPEMIADQKWRAHATRGEWNENCPWYLDEFFDHLMIDSEDDEKENDAEYSDANCASESSSSMIRPVDSCLKIQEWEIFEAANRKELISIIMGIPLANWPNS